MKAAGDDHREDPIDPARIRMVATVVVAGYRKAALACTSVIELERGNARTRTTRERAMSQRR